MNSVNATATNTKMGMEDAGLQDPAIAKQVVGTIPLGRIAGK